MVPNGARQIDVRGFSAGSYSGLAVHSVLSDFACFPHDTKVAAIASPARCRPHSAAFTAIHR